MTRRKRSRRAGRGVLFLVAAMLVMSGLLRFGSGQGQALARDLVGTVALAPETADLAEGEDTPELSPLLAALAEREERVARRERAVEERLAALTAVEGRIDGKLVELAAAEEALAATVARVETASETDVTRLTSVYENMKPKDAAALFEAMDPDFAAGFLGRMRPDAAAAVLAGLSPEVAYAISLILAGRNASAPKN